MKRLIDVVLSLAALLVFLPVIALTAILVRWHFGNPVFFRQRRPGLHGEPFHLLKFRSMFAGAEMNIHNVLGLYY